MFNIKRKKSDSATQKPNLIVNEKPKLVKSVSIARIFGNAYSTQSQQQLQHMPLNKNGIVTSVNSKHLFANRYESSVNRIRAERFKHRSETQIDHMNDNQQSSYKAMESLPIGDFYDEKDLSTRAIRTLSKGIGLIWRRSYSVEISTPDPEYKVFYLGNVLTGWAKGDNCVDKPLSTLWRNYTQINKPDVTMRILVCPSGLKVTTRQHGLTEYWANRICFCCAPKNYPRVFCWIYRHEGRKLKHELRCHAVLCPKDTVAEQICQTLKENLSQALKEFKRDKMNRQNARLSLVNSLYENPSMPRRKILLSVGANNYRPPMERSKSAPKLMAIEEAICEEEDVNSTSSLNRAQSQSSCCNVNLMLASSSFGRSNYMRYADSAKLRNISLKSRSILDDKTFQCMPSLPSKYSWLEGQSLIDTSIDGSELNGDSNQFSEDVEEDILERIHNAESITNASHPNMNILLGSLSEEILSYFDSKLKLQPAANDLDDLNIETDGIYETDEKCDQTHRFKFDCCDSNNLRCEQSSKAIFFNQNEILDSLVIASDVKNTHFKYDKITNTGTNIPPSNLNTSKIVNSMVLDSDEGSLTSGCDTASIVTNAHLDDLNRNERDIGLSSVPLSSMLDKSSISNESNALTYSAATSAQSRLLTSSKVDCIPGVEEDSEFSDESGFDENNVSKVESFFKISNRIDRNCLYSNADANNNVKRAPSSNLGRLRINLPKNAKSIDI